MQRKRPQYTLAGHADRYMAVFKYQYPLTNHADRYVCHQISVSHADRHVFVMKSQYPLAGHVDRYMPVIQSSQRTLYVQKSICHSGLITHFTRDSVLLGCDTVPHDV